MSSSGSGSSIAWEDVATDDDGNDAACMARKQFKAIAVWVKRKSHYTLFMLTCSLFQLYCLGVSQDSGIQALPVEMRGDKVLLL